MAASRKSAAASGPSTQLLASPGDTGLRAPLARIAGLLPDMAPVSARIGRFIIDHAAMVVQMSVSELAARLECSEGSIVAFCKLVGATGFQQLKIALAQETVQPVQIIHEDLAPEDSAATVVAKIFQSNIQTLQETAAVLDTAALQKAVDILAGARQIQIYGIGSSATIAEDAHYRMLRIGLNAIALTDSHVQAISAALTGPDVAVLTISHSGRTDETLLATRLAKEAGARTISITNFGRSPIQALSDVVLFTSARETRFRSEAMTSRLAQLAIIDTLIACLALANYDESVATLRRTFGVLGLKRSRPQE